jgi:hypothetical protein
VNEAIESIENAGPRVARAVELTIAVPNAPATHHRLGDLQPFPFVSISIGVATTENRAFTHYAEVVGIATEMKPVAKKTPGSSWAADRRTN